MKELGDSVAQEALELAKFKCESYLRLLAARIRYEQIVNLSRPDKVIREQIVSAAGYDLRKHPLDYGMAPIREQKTLTIEKNRTKMYRWGAGAGKLTDYESIVWVALAGHCWMLRWRHPAKGESARLTRFEAETYLKWADKADHDEWASGSLSASEMEALRHFDEKMKARAHGKSNP